MADENDNGHEALSDDEVEYKPIKEKLFTNPEKYI